MLKRSHIVLVVIGLCAVEAMAQTPPPCPGFNPAHNVNLACEIATATRYNSQTTSALAGFPPALAAQLSQLPLATAISGSGLTFKGGIPTVSTESLGTILTQRGETLGKHRFFLSVNYQRFDFGSIDGLSLKNLPTGDVQPPPPTGVYVKAQTRIDLKVDQFTALGSFGLTDRIDISFIVPFSKVSLTTGSTGCQYNNVASATQQVCPSPLPPLGVSSFTYYFPGSAQGLGDVSVDLKANVLKLERTSMAVGGEVRFPTGDETNYLGTGAYGVKPYVVFSHRGRITPNINLAYQANGSSALFTDLKTGVHLRLPDSFMYSGGADFLVVKRFTLTAEFLGQYVINGPRITLGTLQSNGNLVPTVNPLTGSYAMDNAGAGFKINLFKGLLISANVMFKLDKGGLRSNVVPLAGISYRF